jgi:hypothetical protein
LNIFFHRIFTMKNKTIKTCCEVCFTGFIF